MSGNTNFQTLFKNYLNTIVCWRMNFNVVAVVRYVGVAVLACGVVNQKWIVSAVHVYIGGC